METRTDLCPWTPMNNFSSTQETSPSSSNNTSVTGARTEKSPNQQSQVNESFNAELSNTPSGAQAIHFIQSAFQLGKEFVQALVRIGDKIEALAPPIPSRVGTRYVADQLDVTVTWVSQMARRNEIPKSCIVAGNGKGKQWKFNKKEIDKWIKER